MGKLTSCRLSPKTRTTQISHISCSHHLPANYCMCAVGLNLNLVIDELCIQWIYQNVCAFPPDYTSLLRKLSDPLQIRANECVIQFPFNAPVENEKTEEELAKAAERRRQQGKKLQEIAAAKRAEKVLLLLQSREVHTNSPSSSPISKNTTNALRSSFSDAIQRQMTNGG